MAKLSAHGSEVVRLQRRHEDSEDCDNRVTLYVVMSDRVILERYSVHFKADATRKDGYNHTWGWKRYGKVRVGGTRVWVGFQLQKPHTTQVGIADFSLVNE